MRAGLSALLSHWRRRPFQLLTLVLGLATATALWSGVQAINAEARASYDEAAAVLAGPALDTVERAAGGTIAVEEWLALRRAGWQVSPVIEGRLARHDLAILGIDPFTLPPDAIPGEDDGAAFDAGFLTGPGQILVAPETAQALRGADLPPRIEVEGIPPGTAYADIATARALLGQDGFARLFVTGPPSLGAPPLERIAPELERRAPRASGGDVARLTDSFHLNLTAFGLLSFAVGLFIVRGAIALAFEQRRPVFRTLRALGLPRATLAGLLAVELLVLALVSGALGVALGWLVASLLIPDVAATLRGLYGAEVSGSLSLRPSWWLSGVGIAVAGTALAGAASLWRIYRLPILAPAQPRAWARAGARAAWAQGAGAVACAGVALVAGFAFDGLVAGFVLLGAALLAAALALPLALDAGLAILSRSARGPRAEWFWADTRQQVPGLSLALMALLLALAANVGVGTMVSSFRLTFTGWLDQRLASELYVRAETPAQAAALTDWLGPRTREILPIQSTDTPLAGTPGEVFGVAARSPTYRDHWPLIAQAPEVWDRVAAGEAVLVNEQLARRDGLWPGAEIEIAGWPTEVAGVYSDYGNPLPQALVGLDRYRALFPESVALNFGIRVAPDETAALIRGMTDEVGIAREAISDQASIKAFSLGIFERTFTVTAALNVLTLSVAGLAILTSLLTVASMRQPQLAPVWALGLSRAALARLELLRAVLLAALTFVLALPVGLLLAWILLDVINVEAFGWRLPMRVFPLDWLALAGLSLVAAALAALLPAIRLRRMPPARLLQVFANER
ncbi:FtsX-like permease family protein [Palleronia sediminis]|uniref:FtsX-like permease family protein n=1 Tax=Palleronia sediminis TaxID=2547833 RepID=UPI0014552E36|nr:ABC transporter permease [Palleronia sediminis]